ncbi:glycosyltransferase family 4 protein [Desulfothermus naphthae]
MNKLKIVFFVISAGGVKKHIIDLVSRLDKEKFEIIGVFPDKLLLKSVIKDEKNKYSSCFRELGHKYYILEIPPGINFLTDIKAIIRLISILLKERPQILHCHSSIAGAIGRIAGRLCGIPKIIYTPHCMYYQWVGGVKKYIYYILERMLFYLSDKIIAVSHSEFQELCSVFPTAKRLIQINNGVDIEMLVQHKSSVDVEKLKNSLGVEKGSKIILSVARLSPQKDIMTLLKAVYVGKEKFNNTVVLIAGEGDQYEELKNYVDTRGLNKRIIFLGWRDDIYDLMAICDIVVLSSKKEGMPYSVIEAGAMAKPVVGSDTTGIKDGIIHRKTGFLFPVGDAKALSNYLQLLVNNPNLCIEMGHRAQAFIRSNFNVHNMVKATEQLYLGKG